MEPVVTLASQAGIALALAVTVWGACLAAPPCKSYSSKRLGYSVCYPASWFLLDPGIDPADIVNFPPERRVKAVIIPENGALVTVVGPQEGVTSVADWVRHDLRGRAPRTQRTIEISCSRLFPLEVIETSQSELAVAPFLVSVNDYFVVDGRLFLARLLYWEGDPAARNYIGVLHQVIRTMRVTGGR